MSDTAKYHKRYVIHMKHPVQRMAPWITMRCGRLVNKNKDIFNITTNPEEVTCVACRGFIENPFRSLRRYGRLTIINDFSITLTHAFGYNWDIVAVKNTPLTWSIFIGIDNTLENLYSRKAENTRNAAFQILEIIEKILIPETLENPIYCDSRKYS